MDFHTSILEARGLIEQGNWVDAQNFLLEHSGEELRVETKQDAEAGLLALYYSLLNGGDFTSAALLRYGKHLFTPEPRSVQLIWKHLINPKESKVIILGCGSSGKTYSASAWSDLYWSIDPQYTCGKIVSTTMGHNKSGFMSKLSLFHNGSILTIPGEITASGIIYPGDDRAASITAVAIPEGDTGEGRLTGTHPYPRIKPHPILGPLSRCFVVIDEADQVPEGAFRGVDNILGNEDYQGSIKVIALTNPRDKHNPCANRAEPIDGWSSVDDTMDEWVSREGWNVVRLDAAKSENVTSKKTIFPGLMSYEGYMNYVRKGEQDPSYWIYARGMYPPEMAASFNVFSLSSFNDCLGRWMFDGQVTPIASIDPAFAEGGDDAILTIGRFGTAIGWTDEHREYKELERPKKVIQVEAQINLVKGKTYEMANQIMAILRSYGVRPEWVTMDRSGNARGLFDHLVWQFGSILGVEWGAKATEIKILHEDTEPADKKYKGIAAEMWFAASIWLEHQYIKLAPSIDGFYKLRDELVMRQWKFFQTLQKLEEKTDFKKNNKGKSCDRSDSFVMLPHSVRVHGQGLPVTLGDNPITLKNSIWQKDHSIVDDQIPFIPDQNLR